MNVVFTVIFLASAIAFAFIAPDKLLSSLLGGAEGGVKMAFTLFAVYAVWMGLSRVAEDSGLSRGAAKLLTPLSGKIFKSRDKKVNADVAMNLSCNLLGLGGAATPYAVKAVRGMEKEGNVFGQRLLFIINATSIQILPTTVIALRAAAGSAAPFDIFAPSLICTALSTGVAVLLYLAAVKIWR